MGTKILEEVDSSINGKITVIKSIAFGTYIQVDGLTQSGGVVSDVWKTTLKKVHKTLIINNRSLILGFGGGSASKLIRKHWPEVKITGVDIDPIIVELGKKYLKFDDDRVEVLIGDTMDLLTKQLTPITDRLFDLILVDMYVGQSIPDKFETDEFVKLVKRRLTDKGVAVFNRLYYGEKRPLAMKFMKKLESNFAVVTPVYPEANVMFVCR